MNYTQLVTLIQQYTENDETTFVANIPTFVALAEERIYRLVKLPKLRKYTVSLSLTAGTQSLDTPADFLAVDYMEVVDPNGNAILLLPKEPGFMHQAFPLDSVQAIPQYYALRDNATLIFGPVPDQNYAINLAYLYKPNSIVQDGTNWIGDNASMALLYGSLIEAYTYMKGEDSLMQVYDQRFNEAIGRAKVLGEGKDRTDENRNSPTRAPQS